MNQAVLNYYNEHAGDFLEGLMRLLRIPSISTDPAHAGHIEEAAQFLCHDLAAMGLNGARIVDAGGHPLVYAEWLGAEGKPTLLIYGHYDVQPPDPLDEWITPPFEPDIRNDNIYARGAVDDKGQTWLILKALEGFLKTTGSLPVNIKVLIEGEEETDGAALDNYLREHGKELGADAALICDTEMFAPGLPSICVGLRGVVYTEIHVQGARIDLHSGLYGGNAPNPFQALAHILAGLKDPDGRILIPHFYDEVTPPSDAERAAWESLPFDEEEYLEKEIGSPCLVGEPEYSALERAGARPTLDIHGIRGGFTGEGAKTVIPAECTAKVSMRVVPHMNPDETFARYEKYVHELTPAGVTVTVKKLAANAGSLTETDNRFIQTCAEAMKQTFEKETVYIRGGGSIPVVGLFQQYLGIPSVMAGFGLPDDQLHAPNEKFHLPNFYAGVETIGRYLHLLGEN